MFSVKAKVTGIPANIAEELNTKWSTEFDTEIYDEDGIEELIREDIDDHPDITDEEKAEAGIEVEVTGVVPGEDSHFTAEDLKDLSFSDAKELLETEEELDTLGEAFTVWYREQGNDSKQDFEDAYCGEYDSHDKFCEEYCEDADETLNDIPDYIRHNIDWDGVWHYGFKYDFWEAEGFYFRN